MIRNKSLTGILYAEDFDVMEPIAVPLETPLAQAEPVILEPTFSLNDMKHASERARQEERVLAREQTELDATQLRTQTLVRLADALAQARSEVARVAGEAAGATAQTLLSMIAAVLPELAASHGHGEAIALLRLLLPAMNNEPCLTIRAHPQSITGLRGETEVLLNERSTVVEWVGLESMLVGDIVVRWQDGAMVRDTDALCAQVRALVAPTAAHSNRTGETGDAE
jgi:hypothetical protein